jgi:hypothetical protein
MSGDTRVTLSKLEALFLGRLGEAGLPLPQTNRRAGGLRYTFGDVFETPELMLSELRALLGPTVLSGSRGTTSGQDGWA